MTTTIRVRHSTRQELAALKSSPRETYDDVLSKLMSLIPETDDEGVYSDSIRSEPLYARLDLRAGRVAPHEQVKRRLGL
jgi:hypothetical protein